MTCSARPSGCSTTVRQSAQFAQLAGIKGVAGIDVGSYTAQFDDLPSVMSSTTGPVVRSHPSVDGPQLSVTAGTPAPTSGWYNGPVTVSVSVDDPDHAQIYVDTDSGELLPYTGPVTVTGDGVHEVRAFAVGDDGSYSTIETLSVKIDSEAPTVAASTTAGTLVLQASDALSGVDSVEYSLDGTTWLAYAGPVGVPGASTAVTYRATDVAGNVSPVGSVTVKGAPLSLAKPVVKGTAKVGKSLTATVASHTAGSTLKYRWHRDGQAIAGATSATYVLKAADRGAKVSVTVTATKPGYASVSKASAAVKVK